jgi:hypothetical protein
MFSRTASRKSAHRSERRLVPRARWWPAAIATLLFGLAAEPARAQDGAPAQQPGAAPETAAGQQPGDAQQPPAPAQSEVEICLGAHLQGQELRASSKLLESREQFRQCARPVCPSAIARDCAEWLGQYERRIPSISVRVTADGAGRTDARVSLDGVPVEGLLGKAVELNPGEHVVRVELPPFAPFETTVLINDGDQFRVVEAKFASASKPSLAAQQQAPVIMERPVPTLAYVFGAVTLAAAANGAGWALSSMSLRSDMEKKCAPGCNPDTVAVLRQRATIADISWGVSAASLITTVTLYALRPELPQESEQPIGVGLNVLPGGVLGSVSVSAF